MGALPGLVALGALLALLGPRALARARWTEREPVVGLWAWQCLVVGVLLCCVCALVLTGAAAWPAVRSLVFTGAPAGVEEAYGFPLARPWAIGAAFVFAVGGVRTALALAVEVSGSRATRLRQHRQLKAQAPDLHPELRPGPHPDLKQSAAPWSRSERSEHSGQSEKLVVLESEELKAWSLPGPVPRLVVTTAALRRLSTRELDALLAHERGHVRARHHWLSGFAEALVSAFPAIRLFGQFRDQVGHLVELAADDSAARSHGRLATAIALVELNPDSPCPHPLAQIPARVDRLLAGGTRLPWPSRLGLTVAAVALALTPVVLTFTPGLSALV
ncbi:M56 family metallopeptidase [Streptacidiphilus fuscans]|uniref:M56 family metallopeptidase n=1 Tax=Streptacidiphilus fuscans TaxID=2789292 RepID=A0A931B724_9ACTN|nr:M56 family metallopeptidase [Streptacidiphilus fuscans]MBF9070186.1 M56 family metallopeptidase [Streptacidiphilus fuscans]